MSSNSSNNIETAIFAGGCFWCVEEVFHDLPGVLSVTSGYTGGRIKNPTYEQVCQENTGHMESIQIIFDPSITSYEDLLNIFWHNIDPTDGTGQFSDRGDSYRSAIFYTNENQKASALESKAAIEKKLNTKVVTLIIPSSEFYPAEEYHQQYHKKNPIRYQTYHHFCGRNQRLKEIWD